MRRSNVALVGFMGAGKSTVGRALAVRMRKTYIETDGLVEHRAGMSIADIFARFGEAHFRDLEAAAVKEAAAANGAVIACGGGVVLRAENVTVLKDTSVLVYLDASAETVLRRLGPQSAVRPLLQGGDREQQVAELMARRRPVYEAAADITVKTDGLLVEQIARRIQRRVGQL
ncbi:MAG: shikimate kinase [Dehalococcoidia bacterium]|nr:shikimate kinase [Dehalococcoidia bacterium]